MAKRVKKAVTKATEPVEAPAKANPPHRPSSFTPEIGEMICDLIADGKTLPQICASPTMPHESTIRRWARADETFRASYARAREEQMHTWADEIVTIADDSTRDMIEADGAKRVDHDHINRSKLRIDTRKFLMAKIAPKTFGEKLDVDVRTGPLDGMTDEQLADHINRLAVSAGVSLAQSRDGDGGAEAPAVKKSPRLI